MMVISKKKIVLLFFYTCTPFLHAQIEKIDIDSKEYVEWVGSCETEVVEKAQLKGLAAQIGRAHV